MSRWDGITVADLFGADPSNLNTFFNWRRPRPAPPPENEESVPGRLCWGALGALPAPKLVTNDSFEVLDCNERHVEASRVADDIRIENPDDSEQWVEVNRANKIVFNKTEKNLSANDNTSTIEPEGIGDFSPSSIVRESFQPLGTADTKRCKLTVNLNNGPKSA